MNILIDSDKLQGVIRLPIQLQLTVVRGFSGSIQTLPMQYPFVEWGSHATFDEVITENQSTIPCPTYNNTIAIIDKALCM